MTPIALVPRALAWAAVLAVLAGCAGGEAVRLRGAVVPPAAGTLKPGSTLTVELLEADEDGPRVLARRRVAATPRKPMPFAFELDADALSEGRYLLRAGVTERDGLLCWATPQPLPLRRASPRRELRLALQPVATPRGGFLVLCDGLAARAGRAGATLRLALPGREARLAPVASRFGAQFGDGRILLWTSGCEALLVLDGRVFRGCRVWPG